MRLPASLPTTTLLLVLPMGCGEPPSEGPVPDDLPQVAFRAFVADNLRLLDDRLMTESRFHTVFDFQDFNVGKPRPSDAEIAKAAKRAASLYESDFRGIQKLLAASGFDWERAQLTAIDTIIRDGRRTRRVPYDNTRTERRLSIWLQIKSSEKRILLQLNSCFLIDGKRYIGGGFHLRAWSGFQLDRKTMADLGGRLCERATNPRSPDPGFVRRRPNPVPYQ